MKYLAFLIILPIFSFAETLSVALYEGHDDYSQHSKAYKLNWQLFKLTAESEGITLDTKEYLWLRGMHYIENEKVDALIGAYYSKERATFAHFSHPLSLDNVYLYTKKSNAQPLEELNKKEVLVGVTTRSIGEELAKELGFRHIYRKSSSDEVFDLLIKNKLQFGIFSESIKSKHCALLIRIEQNNDCLTPIIPALKANAFHTIYSRSPRVIKIANRLDLALNNLIQNGTVKQLFLELNYSEHEYENWLTVRNHWMNQKSENH